MTREEGLLVQTLNLDLLRDIVCEMQLLCAGNWSDFGWISLLLDPAWCIRESLIAI